MKMDLDFTNKKVLVTGAGKGTILDFVYWSVFKDITKNKNDQNIRRSLVKSTWI